MGRDTTKASDHPSTNALAGIQVYTGEREIRLGQNVLLVLDDPPKLGDTRDIVLRLRCKTRAEEQNNAECDTTHYCGMKIVTAWELGQPKPANPEENQLSLIKTEGDDADAEAGEGDGGE